MGMIPNLPPCARTNRSRFGYSSGGGAVCEGSVHELKAKGVTLRATEQPIDTSTAAGVYKGRKQSVDVEKVRGAEGGGHKAGGDRAGTGHQPSFGLSGAEGRPSPVAALISPLPQDPENDTKRNRVRLARDRLC
jgi:hypothetical protein